MQERDVGQAFRVEHARDATADVVVQGILARVDERGSFIVYQELILGDVQLGKPGGDAVDAACYVIDTSIHESHFSAPGPLVDRAIMLSATGMASVVYAQGDCRARLFVLRQGASLAHGLSLRGS